MKQEENEPIEFKLRLEPALFDLSPAHALLRFDQEFQDFRIAARKWVVAKLNDSAGVESQPQCDEMA